MQTPAGNNKILVCSASGSVGFDLCKCLLEKNRPFKACIRTGTRNERKVQQLHAMKSKDTKGIMEIVEIDWASLDSVKQAMKGCDRAFLKCPIGQCETAAKTFMDGLKDNNTIKWIVNFSVYEAEERKNTCMGHEFHKGEQMLKATNVPYCFVRPSILLSNFIFDAKNIKEKGEICRPLGDSRINFVADTDVAEGVCRLLLNDDKTNYGKNFHFFGKECITMNEFSSVLSKELGRQITYRDVSEDEFAKCLLDQGFNREKIESYLCLMKFGKEGGYNKLFDDLKILLGRDPWGIRDCIQKNLEIFQ